MTLAKSFKIERQKSKAKSALLTMRRIAGSGYADCGNSLLEAINPSYAKASIAYEKAMAWLRENDPECPV